MSDEATRFLEPEPGDRRGRLARALRLVAMVLTLRCEDADRLRMRSRHGETLWAEDLAERLHRGICGTCRRSRRQDDVVDSALAKFAERESTTVGPQG